MSEPNPPFDKSKSEYVGDGVYAFFEYGGVWLYTYLPENGWNKIWLGSREYEVLKEKYDHRYPKVEVKS